MLSSLKQRTGTEGTEGVGRVELASLPRLIYSTLVHCPVLGLTSFFLLLWRRGAVRFFRFTFFSVYSSLFLSFFWELPSFPICFLLFFFWELSAYSIMGKRRGAYAMSDAWDEYTGENDRVSSRGKAKSRSKTNEQKRRDAALARQVNESRNDRPLLLNNSRLDEVMERENFLTFYTGVLKHIEYLVTGPRMGPEHVRRLLHIWRTRSCWLSSVGERGGRIGELHVSLSGWSVSVPVYSSFCYLEQLKDNFKVLRRDQCTLTFESSVQVQGPDDVGLHVVLNTRASHCLSVRRVPASWEDECTDDANESWVSRVLGDALARGTRKSGLSAMADRVSSNVMLEARNNLREIREALEQRTDSLGRELTSCLERQVAMVRQDVQGFTQSFSAGVTETLPIDVAHKALGLSLSVISIWRTNCELSTLTAHVVHVLHMFQIPAKVMSVAQFLSFDWVREALGPRSQGDEELFLRLAPLAISLLSVAGLSTGAMIAKAPIGSWVGRWGKGARDFGSIWTFVERLVTFVSDRLTEYRTGMSMDMIRSCEQIPAADHVYRELRALSAPEMEAHRGSPEVLRRMLSLRKDALDTQKRVMGLKLSAQALSQWNMVYRSVERLYETMDVSRILNATRYEPLMILIVGPTSIGKSVLTLAFISSLLAALHPDWDIARDWASHVYYRNAGDAYWSRYSQQEVVVNDDFGQRADSTGNPNPEFMEIIQMANIAEFPLPMADVASKGTKFTSRIVVGSSNSARFSVASINEAAALYRRFHVVLFPQVLPQFQMDDGRVCPMKVFRETGSKFSKDIYRFKVGKYVLSGINSYVEFEKDLLGMERTLSFSEVVALCCHHYRTLEARCDELQTFAADTATEFRTAALNGDLGHITDNDKHLLDHGGPVDVPALAKEWAGPGASAEKVTRFEETATRSLANRGPLRSAHHPSNARVAEGFVPQMDGANGDESSSSGGPSSGTYADYYPGQKAAADGAVAALREARWNGKRHLLRQADTWSSFWGDLLPLEQVWLADHLDKNTDFAMTVLKEQVILRFTTGDPWYNRQVLNLELEPLIEPQQPRVRKLAAALLGEQDVFTLALSHRARVAADAMASAEHLPLFSALTATMVAGATAYGLWSWFRSSPSKDTADAEGKVSQDERESRQERHVPRAKARARAARPVRATEQACVDQNGVDIADLVARNIFSVQFAENSPDSATGAWKHKIYGLAIGANLMLLPLHFQAKLATVDVIRLQSAHIIDGVEIPVNRLLSVELLDSENQEVDAMLVSLPRSHFMPMPSIVKHFSEEADISKFKSTGARLIIAGRGPKAKSGLWIANSAPVVVSAVQRGHVRYCEGRFVIRQGYEYEGDTTPGDCGSPLVALNSRILKKIIGMHVAGAPGYPLGWGFSVAITRSMIDDARQAFPEDVGAILEIDTMLKDTNVEAQSADMPSKNVLKCGTSIVSNDVHVRSDYKRSAIAAFLPWQSTVMPTRVGMFDYPTGRQHVVVHGNEKLGKYPRPIPHDFVERANAECNALMALENKVERCVVPIEVACFGDDKPFFKPLNRNASPGLPWAKHRDGLMGKTKWLGSGDERFIAPELRQAVEERIEMARRNKRMPTIWADCAKLEKRPIAKVEAGKTRVFSSGPLDYLIALRMYTLTYSVSIMMHRISNEHAVGVNPVVEANRMRLELERVGPLDEVDAGDQQGFDGSFVPQLWDATLNGVLDFYDDGDENRRIRRVLLDELRSPVHVWRSALFIALCKNPSGHSLTVILNGEYHKRLRRVAFYMVVEGTSLARDSYREHIASLFLGDDNFSNVSQAARAVGVNSRSLAAAMLVMGHVYLSPEKVPFTEDFVKYLRASFLGRRFRKDPIYGWILALETSVIQDTVMWVRACADEGDALKQNIQVALLEASAHTDEFYEFFGTSLKKALSKLKTRPYVEILPRKLALEKLCSFHEG